MKLEKFPETYPWTNGKGYEFTKMHVDILYKQCTKLLKMRMKEPAQFGLEIAEVMLQVMGSFDEARGVPLESYARVCMRNRMTKWTRSKAEYILVGGDYVKVQEVSLTEEIEIQEKDLTDQKSIVYSIVRHIERSLGKRAAEYLRFKYAGYSDERIAKELKISYSTVMRTKEKIEEELVQI